MRRRAAGASDRKHDGYGEREPEVGRVRERGLEGSGGRGRPREERLAGAMKEGGLVSCRFVLCCVEKCCLVQCRVVSCRVVFCCVVSCWDVLC